MSLVKFRSGNHPQQVLVRGAKHEIDDRATAPEFFAKLDARFRFSIDVAASAHNTKCERYYDLEANGLEQSWARERVFCNPPYSSIAPWVEKAWVETSPLTSTNPAPLVVMLLPANRTEQAWWQDQVEPHRDGSYPDSPLRVEFLRGRLRFIRADSHDIGPNERPPFGCCLLIWGSSGLSEHGGVTV